MPLSLQSKLMSSLALESLLKSFGLPAGLRAQGLGAIPE